MRRAPATGKIVPKSYCTLELLYIGAIMRKDPAEYHRQVSLLGCEVPKGFLLRFQAMQVLRGDDKGALIAGAVEADLERWEARLSDKDAATYKSILEAKAKQNGLYVKDLVAPLQFKRLAKGTRKLVKLAEAKPTKWPKIKKS